MDKEEMNGRKIILKTSSMGILIAAKGQAAKMINEDMRNPNINRDVMLKCANLAGSLTVRKPKK